MKYSIFSVCVAVLVMCPGMKTARAELFQCVQGKEFHITGFSTGAIPVFTEVLVFGEDGTFIMKKMEAYGDGRYYEFRAGIFYFIFTNRSGIDVQYAEGYGLSLLSVAGQVILGAGSFMIDYTLEPLIYIGLEVFGPEAMGTQSKREVVGDAAKN